MDNKGYLVSIDAGVEPIEWWVSSSYPDVMALSPGDWVAVQVKQRDGLFYTNVAEVDSFDENAGQRMRARLHGFGMLLSRHAPTNWRPVLELIQDGMADSLCVRVGRYATK